MTTGEMIGLCATRIGQPNISVTMRAQILAELNQALRFLYHKRWDWRGHNITFDITNVTTTIALGSGYDGIMRVGLGTYGNELPPRSSQVEAIENLITSVRTRGRPACWDAFYDDGVAYLVVLPYSSVSVTLYVRALYGFRALAGDATEPAGLPEQWQDFLVDRAAASLSVITQCDPDIAILFERRAVATYNQMKADCHLVQAPIRAIPFLHGQFGA